MKRITLARLAVLMLAVAGLVLQGCGGDDAYSISADDQARIDALMAELEEAEEDLEAATERAEEAEGQVEYLTGKIGMMDDMADPDGSLYAQLNDKMAALMAAQAEVTRLTGVIGMDPSDDDPNGSGLRGDLAMAQADLAASQMEVGRLTGVIGMAPSDDDPNGSGLMGDLAMANADLMAANDKVAMLEEQLGRMPGDGDGGSGLRKELADAQADRDMYMTRANELAETLGMMDDPTTDANEATGLRADLMAAQADRDMYKGMIGSEDDAADAEGSLHAQLNAKQDEIDKLTADLKTANDELAKLRAEDVVEDNIERGEAIMDQIYAAIDNTTGLTVDSTASAVMSVSATCTTDDCPNHDVFVDDGEIEVEDFTGATSKAGEWLNATMTNGVQTVEVYADTARNDTTDVVYFGWWLNEPDVVSDLSYDLSVYAGGSNPALPGTDATMPVDNTNAIASAALDAFEAISGEATYEGTAAGQYAAEVRTAGARSDMDSGSFTADVELTADFGPAADTTDPAITAADMALLTISGEIDNFAVSGSVDPSLWGITLKTPAGAGTQGDIFADTPETTMFAGEATLTIGGLDGRDGMWQGRFYRARTEAVGVGTPDNIAPGVVAGTFGIEDRQLAIIGAFGAHVDD